MKNLIRLSSILLAIAVFISACAPGGIPAADQPDLPELPATHVPTPYDAPIQPPEAAIQARQSLANELGIDPEQITIANIEETDWPDSCLGAGGPAEICAAVITPGYRVELSVDGKNYEARTNLDGSVVRRVETSLPDTSGGVGDTSELAQAAAQKLAELAGLRVEDIRVLSSEPMEWPSGCLGAAEMDEACTAIIVPGYKFEMESGGLAYSLHTNQDLSQARLGGPEETLVIVKVRQQAAADRAVGLEEVTLVSSEMVRWPNSCLGVERDGIMCMMVITPGYRIKVSVLNTVLEYHTNKRATSVVLYKP